MHRLGLDGCAHMGVASGNECQEGECRIEQHEWKENRRETFDHAPYNGQPYAKPEAGVSSKERPKQRSSGWQSNGSGKSSKKKGKKQKGRR